MGRIYYSGLYWCPVQVIEWRFVPERLVPLEHVHVEACIVDSTAEVKITQRYINQQSFPIEAIYAFPLDEHAAVCEFEAEINGKKVIGVVKSKNQAKVEYNQAIQRGDGAYLLEQDKPDIFQAKVGNIPPGDTVSISIKYVAEIQNELEKIRFVLPTYIAPRYSPSGSYSQTSNPSSSPYVHYKMSTNITCISSSPIESIESPSHPISATINDTQASIGLDAGVTELDKDLVILIKYSQPHEPRAMVEDDGKGSKAVMLTFFPNLEFAESKTELFFVVDRSGSMQSKVKELREAMQLFMRSLPVDCYFNIIGFGSSYQKLFPNSKRYNDESLGLATKHISTLNADLGGTEIYQPLNAVFQMPVIPGYSRQVFVLTDGQVSNTEQVIDVVRKNNTKARVFCLGIGDSVSHHLVEGIARAGKGTSFFVMENERIEKKVMKQLKDATQPSLQKVSVNWGLGAVNTGEQQTQPVGGKVMSLLAYKSPAATTKPITIKQCPFIVPPIFDGNHFRIYCLFTGDKLPSSITVKAESPDGPLTVELPVDPTKVIQGNLLHTLAARTLIRDLEEGSSYLHSNNSHPSSSVVQEEIINLGIRYGLASKYTSFLAIEERAPEEKWFNCYAPIYRPQPQPVASFLPQQGGGYGGPQLQMSMMSRISAPVSRKNSSAPRGGGPPPSRGGPPPPPLTTSSNWMANSPQQYNFSPAPAYSSQTESLLSMDSFSSPSNNLPPPPPPAENYYMPNLMDFESHSEEEEMKSESRRSRSKKSKKEETYQPQLNQHELLGDLIAQQSSQGMFNFNQTLSKVIGVDFSLLQNALNDSILQSISNDIREQVWATVLALEYLKKKLGDLVDEWEMTEKKARKWLVSKKIDLSPLFSKASQLIQ